MFKTFQKYILDLPDSSETSKCYFGYIFGHFGVLLPGNLGYFGLILSPPIAQKHPEITNTVRKISKKYQILEKMFKPFQKYILDLLDPPKTSKSYVG